jgi:DNA invertase Pin-like site-specific DNA recombinase
MTKITPEHLARGAFVYVRQSTADQLLHNHESRRRQYGLADRARQLGWQEIVVIDDDLGRSGSGVSRPGFERLLAAICEGRAGAVFAIEASRLARNGRDWHTLIEFCGLVGTIIIDEDGVYEPRHPNDRLLLGMKGTMSELELSILRQRSLEALKQKARRGELFLTVAIGYVKVRHDRIAKDPDQRVREAVALVFSKFAEFQSIRQVHLWFRQERIALPAVSYTVAEGRSIVWKLPVYNTVHHILTNPTRRRLCVRPNRQPGDDRGRSQAHCPRPQARTNRMGRLAHGPSRRISLVGGVREESAPDRRQCQQQGSHGAWIGAPWRDAVGRSPALRTLRSEAACRLWGHARRGRPVSLPGQLPEPWRRSLYLLRQLAR